jgi:hypothetical protein
LAHELIFAIHPRHAALVGVLQFSHVTTSIQNIRQDAMIPVQVVNHGAIRHKQEVGAYSLAEGEQRLPTPLGND